MQNDTLSDVFLGGGILVFLGSIFFALFWIVLWWVIFKKAGYSASLLLGIIMVIPFINIIMFLVFALGEWPVLRKLQEKKIGSQRP